MRDEQWTLLQIGIAQERQVQTYGYDKTQHKGFLTDLEFEGAFGDDIMAWGPGALNISPRGKPTFDMTAYTPCDRSTSMPPDRTRRIRRISTPHRFEIAATAVPPHLPDLAEQKTLGVRIQIFFPVRGRGGEVTVGYECDIHDLQSRHLTAEECAHIGVMETGPTDRRKPVNWRCRTNTRFLPTSTLKHSWFNPRKPEHRLIYAGIRLVNGYW